MPNLDLKQLRETFEKSTQGEYVKIGCCVRVIDDGNAFVSQADNEQDAGFIATAHNTYSQLLDIAEAAEKMADAVEHILQTEDYSVGCSICDEMQDDLAAYRKASEGK